MNTKWFAVRSFRGFPVILRLGAHEHWHVQISLIRGRP